MEAEERSLVVNGSKETEGYLERTVKTKERSRFPMEKPPRLEAGGNVPAA